MHMLLLGVMHALADYSLSLLKYLWHFIVLDAFDHALNPVLWYDMMFINFASRKSSSNKNNLK